MVGGTMTTPPLAPAELPVIANALADVAPALPSPQGAAPPDCLWCLCPVSRPQCGFLFCWSWRKHRSY